VKAAAPLALALLVVAGAAAAPPPGDSPFYLVPATTKECRNVKDCVGVPGPWVAVPARGQATYLLACPERRGFAVAGTDARASRGGIRVWFDGKLGAPIGAPSTNVPSTAVLLFHAAANDGRAASFQPILGCVPLTPKSKRSTVSARANVPATPALDLRSEQVGLHLNLPLARTATTLRCPRGEQLVGAWSAFATATTDPPSPAYAAAVTIGTTLADGRVHATFRKDRLFSALAPRSWAQVGAMCQP
jgi:hypothetical protein